MGKRISELTTAGAITGNEYIEMVQDGSSVKVSHNNLTAKVGGILANRIIYGDGAAAITAITDANAPTKSGFYRLGTPYTNGPGAWTVHILHIQDDRAADICSQIAVRAGVAPSLFIRHNNSGTWGSWEFIWNSGNDLQGSGLTADSITEATPANAGATGTKGTIRFDANYVYICVATNTWARYAKAAW